MGEKGQVIIPAEARKAMDIKKGEKLLVFGMGCDMLAFSKLLIFEREPVFMGRKVHVIFVNEKLRF